MNTHATTQPDDLIELAVAACAAESSRIGREISRLEATDSFTRSDCERLRRDLDRLDPLLRAIRRALLARSAPSDRPARLH
jgi:hypothetical protein